MFLRGLSSVLMAESLSRLDGIRKLCLSSIFGTALRCPNPTIPSQVDHLSIPIEPEASHIEDGQDERLGSSTNIGTSTNPRMPTLSVSTGRLRRTLSAPNPVWQSIPSSIEELSIDITRLPDHGPWNQRSSGQLARTLTTLITSGQCPRLRKIGSVLGDSGFEFGIYGPHGDDSPLAEFKDAARSHRVSLVPSFWNDSFVTNHSATHWYC